MPKFILTFLFLLTFCSTAVAQAPKWFMGQWSGTIHQVGVSTPYSGVISVDNFSPGSYAGTSYYPELNCGGTLSLVSATASLAIFTETITFGAGCVNGQIRLANTSPSQVAYDWYTYYGAHQIFSQPMTRSEPVICGNPELRGQFAPNHPNRHLYYQLTRICAPGEGSGSIPCTAQSIFNLMTSKLRFVAPALPSNQNTAVTDCATYNLEPAFSPNPITTRVDSSSLAVANYTMVNHIFHPGVVIRVVLTFSDSNVYVVTLGTGVGAFRAENMSLGPILFGLIDQDLRLEYLTH